MGGRNKSMRSQNVSFICLVIACVVEFETHSWMKVSVLLILYQTYIFDNAEMEKNSEL